MTAWIQSVAALCIVVLTAWTLRVLREYALDTKRIANDGASQPERAQMPYIAVCFGEPEGYFMQNQGFGPALNIRWVFTADGSTRVHRDIPSLGVQMKRSAHNDISTCLVQQHQPFEISYQSLSGKSYETIVTIVDNAMHSEFRKL
jgi:hypothetical protein